MKFYASDLLPQPEIAARLPADYYGAAASDLLAAMPDGLAVLSLDGVVRAANRPFERLMNRSIAEMRGRPLILLGSTNEIVAAIDGAVSRMRQLDVAGTLESGRTVFASVRILRDDKGEAFGALLILNDPSRARAPADRRKDPFRFSGDGHDAGPVFIESAESATLLRQGAAALSRNARVLLTGESGTGKTELARRLRDLVSGGSTTMPFVHVNCGSIPESLFESEMFGYEPGAFTGAAARGKTGYVEAAENGVLFLDEIGEIPLPMQAKLLTFLEDGTFMRVGSPVRRRARIKIISATNRHLPEMIEAGTFRRDLYYRLAVVSLECPPLRGRRELVRAIGEAFLKRINREREPSLSLAPALWEALLDHDWPGNIRELSNVLEHVAAVADNRATAVHLPPHFRSARAPDALPAAAPDGDEPPLREALRQYEDFLISRAIDRHGSKRRAAKALGVDIGTLVRKTTRR
ncbi:sigma-54 interaction domain-containing protein [Segnochrobactrum spirostomi]|uniref:HTH-type transcriptional regulatory protein TyrR n=1 Tax=Segnochrobactrum spirostomi TaxID=2608987 RepID=A0A6A7Y6F4_9HYPH|nr:sigma 54-interacting transcriptional regulator [Segnochrobactrum spirostomi]MQT14824.1 AAA domain-containing protein [Segnochrobactrum spirostomi]